MKKIILSFICLLVFIPIFIFADMGSPIINEYKVTINNPNGAIGYTDDNNKYVKTDKVIPYGTIIFVDDYELAEEGYAIYSFDNDEEESYYVKLNDTELVEKNYKVNENDLANKEKAIILKDSVIRKGPANAYESTGVTIKAGTTVDVRFFRAGIDGAEGDNAENESISNEIVPDYGNVFAYVEYNGTKGFICTYGATVAFNELDDGLLTYSDSEIKDPVSGKIIGKVKANTLFNKNIYLVDEWSRSYYVIYNGVKGLVYRSPYIWKNDSVEFTATKQLKIYKHLEDDMEKYEKSLNTIGTIEKGKTFSSNYYDIYDGCRIYYKNGNIEGWVYTNMKEDSDGCVGIDFSDDVESEGETMENTPIVVEPSENISIEVADAVSPVVERMGSLKTLYIYIGIAAVVCLTAIVTLILINKKKKPSNEEIKETVEEAKNKE